MKEWVLKYWPIITFLSLGFIASMGKMYDISLRQELLGQQQLTIIKDISVLNSLFQERLTSNMTLIDYKLQACGCNAKRA